MWSLIRTWFPAPVREDDPDESELLFESDGSSAEFSVKEGTVTVLNEDYGLVDDRWQFDRDLKPKICDGPIRVGQKISVRLTRPKDSEQEWRIEQILSAGEKGKFSGLDRSVEDSSSSNLLRRFQVRNGKRTSLLLDPRERKSPTGACPAARNTGSSRKRGRERSSSRS